ncbi:MAG: hypothetical protein GTO41_13775 [Burkholderiales bacterium]|nr:hypothetical protein [Burkholderiales bacterium]
MRMLGKVLAVNTVLDEHRRMSFVNFGEIVKSHLEAVQFTENYTVVPISRKFRTVVTSAAGYPLDQTYYQTVKGMVVPADILEPGGNLIIASECTEGIGSSEYADAQRRLIEKGVEGFLTTSTPRITLTSTSGRRKCNSSRCVLDQFISIPLAYLKRTSASQGSTWLIRLTTRCVTVSRPALQTMATQVSRLYLKGPTLCLPTGQLPSLLRWEQHAAGGKE